MGELIGERYPDVKVVNRNNADLFISIHTNSAESKTPRGVETFILGTDKLEANLDVAMRENAVMKLESDYKTTYQGFDPNSIDSYIMFELMQNSHMEQSLSFAEQVQQRFVGHLNREDRGVRQAAFWVLLKTACPSVLFEMGFISNPEEERFLNQPASMAQMANALVNAFGAYTHKQAVKKEKLAVDTVAVADVLPEPSPAETKPSETQPAKSAARTLYAVQICASKTPLAPGDPQLKNQPCDTVHAGGWIKYYTAADPDRNKVAKALPALKSLFPDCWIIKIKK